MSIAVHHRTHAPGAAWSVPVVALTAAHSRSAAAEPSGSVIAMLDAGRTVVTVSASGRFHDGRNTTFTFYVTTEKPGDPKFTYSDDNRMKIDPSKSQDSRDDNTRVFTVTIPAMPGSLSYVATLTSQEPIRSLTPPT